MGVYSEDEATGTFAGNGGDAGSTGVYRLVPSSGTAIVDGLLSGVAWRFNNFTVSYPSNAASYGTNYANGEASSFQPFNGVQQAAADFGRFLLGDYLPVTFTPGNATTANLRYGNFTATGDQVTHAYYPDGFGAMGDVWYSNKNNDQFTATIGGFAFATILHEQGHTFGLKHGQDTGIGGAAPQTADGQLIPNYGPLPPGFDNWNYTIMSYRSYQGAAPNPVQGFMDSNNPVTFMMADIAALQYMYGANFAGFSSTSTLYQWDANGNKFINGNLYLPAAVGGRIFETIWDGGGIDTYDTSNFATNQRIDLRPGAFSTIDSARLADLNRNAPGTTVALGNIANALQFQGDPRSLIENAFTGNGSDTLIGNVAANDLRGGGGNDFLQGGPGGDNLDGGPAFDIATWFPENVAVSINLANQNNNAVGAQGDRIFNVEGFYLTNGNDQFTAAGTSVGLYIYGFAGGDILIGSSGSDFIDGGDGGDVINAGGGFDYVSYNTATTGVTINVPNPVGNQTGAAAGDAISNAEVYILSQFADVFFGGAGQNFAYGYGGADALFGGSGSNDWLFGLDGNDFISGGNLNDLLSGGPGADTYAIQNYFTNGFDSVLDFVTGQDRFQLSGSGFGLSAGYAFTAGFSFISAAAPAPVAATGTLLYYSGLGILYYDIDGTGPGAATPMMQITGAAAVQATDFFVV